MSFRVLDAGIKAPKRTARGGGQRISALAECVDIIQALADVPVGPGLDDCLDASVAAWSARRWLMGDAQVFGIGESGHTARDARGRPMRIVA